MIIINLSGQLGNQMFQYALGRKLFYLERKVKFDTRFYELYPEYYGLHIFNIKVPVANLNECLTIRDEKRTLMDRIRRKFFGKRQNIISEINDLEYVLKDEIFKSKTAYIDGYWQMEDYFVDIKNIIINEFKFPEIFDEKNLFYLHKIKHNLSVSIHVRRGDYINGFPLLTKKYYSHAIEYFESKYNNIIFFVFSNDMEWSKENIQMQNGYFVDCNIGKDSWKDMYLMTQCNHNIIANSSFSWWGAWLNQNKNKEVIAPSEWLYHAENPKIYCDDWIIVENSNKFL